MKRTSALDEDASHGGSKGKKREMQPLTEKTELLPMPLAQGEYSFTIISWNCAGLRVWDLFVQYTF